MSAIYLEAVTGHCRVAFGPDPARLGSAAAGRQSRLGRYDPVPFGM